MQARDLRRLERGVEAGAAAGGGLAGVVGEAVDADDHARAASTARWCSKARALDLALREARLDRRHHAARAVDLVDVAPRRGASISSVSASTA